MIPEPAPAAPNALRFGISSPVLTLAGRREPWEYSAGLAEVVAVARRADELGYHHLTAGDHIAIPPDTVRGDRFWDSVATFSYLACCTRSIRFLTHALVVPLYHPLEIAKRYGMVDMLSDGRLILGMGVGHLEAEFVALGRDFAGRGERADDAIRALRAIMGHRLVSYSGTHYEFDDLVIDPHATQTHVPFWVAGHSRRALQRALTLGDGWLPPPPAFRGPTLDEIDSLLSEQDVPPGFAVMVTTDPLDPINSPEACQAFLDRLVRSGVNTLNLRFRHSSLSECLEQLEAFAQLTEMKPTVTHSHKAVP